MQISKFKHSLLLSSILLAACGGGSDDKTSVDGGNNGGGGTVQTVAIPVTAIDGYIRGATAYVDINTNGELDTDEPRVTTGVSGAGEIDVTNLGLNLEEVQITVIVPAGAIDEDTITDVNPDGTPFTEQEAFELKTLPGSENATPLSTLVSMYAAQTGDLESSKALIASKLGLEASDLDSDFVENENTSLATLAKVMVKSNVLPSKTSVELSSLQTKALLSVTSKVKALSDDVVASENVDAVMAKLINTATAIVKATNSMVESQTDQLIGLPQAQLDLFVGILSDAAVQSFSDVDSANEEQVLLANQIFNASAAVVEDVIANSEVTTDNNSQLLLQASATASLVRNSLMSADLTTHESLSTEDFINIALFIANQVSSQVLAAIESGTELESIIETISENVETTLAVILDSVESGNDINDLDGDGIPNSEDDDIDGDGIPNDEDAFELDPTESIDVDMDGVGDNKDTFVGNKMSLLSTPNTQKIENAQNMTRIGNQVLIPTADGLFYISEDEIRDENSVIKHALQSEFAALNLKVVYHTEPVSETKVLVSAYQDASETQNMTSLYLTLEFIDQEWSLVKVQSDLNLSEVVGESLAYGIDSYVTEIFQLSSNKDYVYSLVTDYSNTFVASYKLNSDNSLTFINSINVGNAVGSQGYEKSLALSSDDQWLYYVSPDGGDYYTSKLGRMAVSPSTGEIESLSIDDISEAAEPHYGIQIVSLADNQMLISNDKNISLFEISPAGILNAVTGISFNETDLAVTNNSAYLSVSPDSSKVALSLFEDKYNGRVKLFEVDNQNELKELSDYKTESFNTATVWSELADRVYSVGLDSGEIQAISLVEQDIKTKSSGIAYITGNFETTASEDGLLLLSASGRLSEVTLNNSQAIQKNLTDLLSIPDADSQTFYMPTFLDANRILSRVHITKEFPSYSVEASVTLFNLNEDKTSATSHELILGSRSGLYPYHAWPVNNELIVTFNSDSNLNAESRYAMALYKFTSATTVELINTIPTSYLNLVNSVLENKSDTEFSINGVMFDISSGELAFSDNDSPVLFFETIKNKQLQITVEMETETETSLKVKKYNAETELYDVISSFDDLNVKALVNWNDEGFVVLDMVKDGEYVVRVYSVSDEGVAIEISSALLRQEIDLQNFVLQTSPSQNQVWIITKNADKDILVLDVNK